MLKSVKDWAMKPSRARRRRIWRLVLCCNLLTVAACAPNEDWSEGGIRGPRCAQVHCDASGSTGCWASTPGITMRVDQSLEFRGVPRGAVAVLPWTLHEDPPACVEHQGCNDKARCIRGRCWSAPCSATQLRRWFRGEAPLAGALPGWRAELQGGSQLRLQSDIAAEWSGFDSGEPMALWAIYVNANWVTSLGHAMGANLEPLAFVPIQGSGKGAWSQVKPRVDARAQLGEDWITMSIPSGWSFDLRWPVKLRCASGQDWALAPCGSADRQLRCPLPKLAKAQLDRGLCRVFVEIPGHAPFASQWFSAREKELGSR